METASIISQIFKSRQILLTFMENQGYNTQEYSNFSSSEVNAMYQSSQLDMLMEKTDPNTGKILKIYIRYYLKTIRPANIGDIVDDLYSLEGTLTEKDTLMIITTNLINDTITQLLKHMYEKDKKFVIIQSIKTLQFNILENILVPPHSILTDEEAEGIKTKYNITHLSQFPEISRFDPVAQIIGLRPGQICKIIRPSKTAIEGVNYRICINN